MSVHSTGTTPVLECESSSSEDKNTLDEKIKASAGGFGLTGSADLNKAVVDIVTLAKNGCSLHVSAKGGAGTVSTKLEDFAQTATNYIFNAPLESSTPLEFSTSPYHQVQDADFQLKVLSKIDLKFSRQNSFLAGQKSLLEYVSRRVDAIDTLLYLGLNMTADKKTSLVQEKRQSEQQMKEISDAILLCSKNPSVSRNCLPQDIVLDW